MEFLTKKCPNNELYRYLGNKAGNGSRTRDIDLGKVALYH